MPYRWTDKPNEMATDLMIWPHRSLTNRGYAVFFVSSAALLVVPVVGLLGSPALWFVLGFGLAALLGVGAAVARNDRDRLVRETLRLTPEKMEVRRIGPRGRRAEWSANPHWVRVRLHRTGGPVPNYLTLAGGPREIELGAFLSAEERAALRDDLTRRLSALS
jgi:uncharacterized membrane protein